MEDIKEVYRNLTQIDINEQKRMWDERGKGYYGEFSVLEKLFFHITPPCKFLMNLEIPTKDGKTTEIDLLMIHSTGIYVFEIKHYKGIIYGNVNDNKWTQFFRTQDNNTFQNPFSQNAYHLRALKELIPNTNLYSVVVFTNEDCELKVENDNNELILSELHALISNLENTFNKYESKYSISDIDNSFSLLSTFSKLTSETIEVDHETPIQFYEYLCSFKDEFDREKESKIDEYRIRKELLENDYKARKNDLENDYKNKKSILVKEKKHNLFVTILGLIACIIISALFCSIYKSTCDSLVDKAKHERLEMEQKFQHVDETDIPYNDIINTILTVDAKFNKSSSIRDTITIKTNLSLNSEKYGIQFNKDTKYIVIKKDGTLLEYDIFNDTNNIYQTYSSRMYPTLYKEKTLKEFDFIGVGNIKDVEYIKITNVTLFDATNYSYPSYADNLEIEIYSAE